MYVESKRNAPRSKRNNSVSTEPVAPGNRVQALGSWASRSAWGYICEENLCIEDVIVEEPTGGPTDEVATQAIYEAEQAINKAKGEGKDTTEAEVYLANPAVAAASAITGKITSPEEIMD